ncbi:Glutamate--tRNA ligase, chloroplastic/mitochondrial [Vitis vinifera]|uniref:Glutamate--tRNA ligase, chloroplastic/mitochondrial n=1 Tax=Vitis vinifera TaxID=29760 RepID=A0A438EKN0_VITVI|nr:Glutamate--tRNA ligase, chloroplastic/mitochondrial [Vitis vinifera]
MKIRVIPEVAPPILRRSSSLFRRSFSVSCSTEAPPKKLEGEVRVRFAPSPTGNLHVGGARTALFNYLFARSKGGKFVLRIEDTDLERSTKQSEEALLQDLSWLGLHWDEGTHEIMLMISLFDEFACSPGVGGDYGPYRQSERNSLYKQYAEKLLESGHVYQCFCSNDGNYVQTLELILLGIGVYIHIMDIPINLYDDILLCHGWTWWEHGVLPMEHSLAFLDNELVSRVIPPCGPCDHCEPCYLELEKMKEIAKLRQLPPVYTGKWASATAEEVQEELERGTPYTYRFRVPKEGSLKIDDLIRGEAGIFLKLWELYLRDLVFIISNQSPTENKSSITSMELGYAWRFCDHEEQRQPVYNFCVTVDDATMAISHVISRRAFTKHSRQALLYKALGFAMPSFAHVSLILAPDRSKLSKRMVQLQWFKEMGFLPQAMVNYLALLGWGDGTENEFFTLKHLVEKFSIDRVNKGGAIFDSTKLRESWRLIKFSAITLCSSTFASKVDEWSALKVTPSEELTSSLVSAGKTLLLATYDSGELLQALEEGPAGWQKWVKSFGKSLKRKSWNLGVVAPQVGFVTLEDRFKMLREVEWEALNKDRPPLESAAPAIN